MIIGNKLVQQLILISLVDKIAWGGHWCGRKLEHPCRENPRVQVGKYHTLLHTTTDNHRGSDSELSCNKRVHCPLLFFNTPLTISEAFSLYMLQWTLHQLWGGFNLTFRYFQPWSLYISLLLENFFFNSLIYMYNF